MTSFNPSGRELIVRYLNSKITEADDPEIENEINEVNICEFEPQEIPNLTKKQSTHTWYVISPVKKLKGKCGRTKRSTRIGSWRITGRDSVVKDIDGKTVGFKKYLVFIEKKGSSSITASPQRRNTTWTIHEFHSSIDHPNKVAFALCKLIKKTSPPPLPTNDVVGDKASPAADQENPTIFTTFDMQNEDIFEGLEDFFPEFLSSYDFVFDQTNYNFV